MTNIFKVRDEYNRFLKAIKEYFEISEHFDFIIIKCKFCEQTAVIGGQIFSTKALMLQHLVQHLKNQEVYNKVIGQQESFDERLQNNEFDSDENEMEKLK
jgi:hypothetical protein